MLNGLQNGAPFCDHSNLCFLEVTWWCGHRRTTPKMLYGVLLQCWDHVDRAWHTPLHLQARCWPSFLCRVILLSTMNITDDHCWMARPTCHLGHCRCARQCLAFIGCNTTVIWNSSHSGEAWSGWSDQTHWFQWRPSNVPVVVLQWHPDGVRRGSSDTGADDTVLSVTREAPLRPFVHWTSVPMSRSQSVTLKVHEQNQFACLLSGYRHSCSVSLRRLTMTISNGHNGHSLSIAFYSPTQTCLLNKSYHYVCVSFEVDPSFEF